MKGTLRLNYSGWSAKNGQHQAAPVWLWCLCITEKFRFWHSQPCKRRGKCLNTNKGLHNRQQGSKTLAALCWYTHTELYSVRLSSPGTIWQLCLDDISTAPLIHLLTTAVWERDEVRLQLSHPLITDTVRVKTIPSQLLFGVFSSMSQTEHCSSGAAKAGFSSSGSPSV